MTQTLISRALRLAAMVAALALAIGVRVGDAAAATPARGPVDVQHFARASNHYSAELKSEGDRLRLSFSRGLLPALVYTFHGRVSSGGIRARIADLGTIDLRFLPSGRTKRVRPPRRCSGPRATLSEGSFVGRLSFRAELGVTDIDLVHAKGAVVVPGWRCHPGGTEEFLERAPSGVTYTALKAIDPSTDVGFGALAGADAEHPVAEGASISASARTRRGSVRVDHLAVALAVGAFSFDSALTTATVSPPDPFRGSATFCRSCAAGSQWTGDLSVSLPGIGHPIALTGPDFRPTLRILSSTPPGEGPTGTVAPDTVIYGSSVTIGGHFLKLFFNSTAAGSTFTCTLDAGDAFPCESPLVLRHLRPGRHQVTVTAIDPAGNADPTPATYHFRVKPRKPGRLPGGRLAN